MNRAGQAAQKHFFRDAMLLLVGAKALRAIGLKPVSFYGGATLGFCGGNMAGVYGFDARHFLTGVEQVMNGGNFKWEYKSENSKEEKKN